MANILLDVNGTIYGYNYMTDMKYALIKDNISVILKIIGNEPIDSISFVSMSLWDKYEGQLFLKHYGKQIAGIFDISIDKISVKEYEKCAIARDYFLAKREAFLLFAPKTGYTMCFDDTFVRKYEIIRGKKRKIELFRV